jgi:hypothetical protein
MTLDLTCQSCDATFDTELADLLEEQKLECPHCEARAPRAALEGVTNALDELFAQLAVLRRKFSVVAEIDSEDLPPPHDREGGSARIAADDDEDEETEDGEGWEEEAGEEVAEEDDER